MIPVAFEYLAPSTIVEAVGALARGGEDAKILAGGHSLLPLMKLRLAAPALVIDLRRISELRYIREAETTLTIGAMTRYVDLEMSEAVRSSAPLLSQSAALVGDAQVRNRGTIGGALAHGDPAGDTPAVVMALDGVIHTMSPRGERSISAGDFFQDIFETALMPDEVITHVAVPSATEPLQHYEKFRRRLCDWAIVGSAVMVEVEDRVVSSARVVLSNVAATPVRAGATEEALTGHRVSRESVAEASAEAANGLDPTSELNAPADYKLHLASVITRRALEKALMAFLPLA